MSSQKKRDQIVLLANRLTEARAAVAAVEAEIDALLTGGNAAEAPPPPRGKSKARVAGGRKAAATRKARREAQAIAEKPAAERTNYEKLVAAVRAKPSKADWSVKELSKASKIKGSSIFEVLKKAVRERVLTKGGYGQYLTGPQGDVASLN